MPPDATAPIVLDGRQLSRIEATHRGFLYQHLFASGCLLKSASALESVILEHDEDLELLTRGRHIYAQVKTRSATLLEGELEGFFTRARELANAHANGSRLGTPEFWLVTIPKYRTASPCGSPPRISRCIPDLQIELLFAHAFSS